MTPTPASAPAAAAVDGSATGKELPGVLLPGLVVSGDAAPFSAALAILQNPLLTNRGQDKPPAKQEGSDQLQLLPVPVDPAAAALAAVLQWLRESAGSQPQPAPDQSEGMLVPADSATIAGIAGGAAAAAPPLSALLAAHFKGNAKSADSSAAGSDASRTGANAAAGPPVAATTAGAAVNPGVLASSISKPTPQDLQSLANMFGQAGAANEAVASPGDRGSEASAALLTAVDSPSSVNSDCAAGTAATASAGLERGASSRAGIATATPQLERTVSVPVHDRHWSQAIAAQVLVLADHRIESATLRLTPEHLGPVDVRIDIEDTQVNVSFGAAHSAPRSALEQALPRLREVLAGAGLTLGEASVQQQMRRGPHNRADGARGIAGAADQQPVTLSGSMRAIGMIDEYA